MSNNRFYALIAAAAIVVLAAGYAYWRYGPTPKGEFAEYAMLEKTDIPTALAIAPDGSVWFTMDSANAFGRLRDGKMERVVTGKRNNVEPIGLGVDGNGVVWYTDALSQAIASMSPDGKLASFPLDTPIARLGRLAVAPDGAIWFAEGTAYSITRLKDGKLTRYEIKNVRGGPYGVTVDAKGNVWATLQSGNQLLRITPAGAMTEYEVPTRGSSPTDIAVDQKGSVWFVEFRGNKVGRFADGNFTEFEVPGANWAGLSGIAIAPDGSVWFGLLRHHAIGRLRDGQMKIFQLPRPDARPYTLAADKAGNIWYADISGYVGMLKAESAKK
ncbi:MAG: SMP-30/gluconolactonase/LRE family protein [Pseudomonadota bacterium]